MREAEPLFFLGHGQMAAQAHDQIRFSFGFDHQTRIGQREVAQQAVAFGQ
jgi:hypothetical protein